MGQGRGGDWGGDWGGTPGHCLATHWEPTGVATGRQAVGCLRPAQVLRWVGVGRCGCRPICTLDWMTGVSLSLSSTMTRGLHWGAPSHHVYHYHWAEQTA